MRDRVRAASVLALPTLMFLLCSPAPGPGQWLSPPGEGWAEATFFFHDTDREYDLDGTERPIFADGRAITRSLFLTGTVGILEGLDAWVQVPFHSLRFDDAGGTRVSRGLGDPRAFLRAGPALVGLPSWPLALRGGVKVDGGDFDVDAEIIPLGEGQRDWELLVELGHSFHPRPFWAMGWIGYRWRRPNVEAARTPGDEVFWLGTVGGMLGPVGWEASLEGLSGSAWMIEGIRVPSARRSITQVLLEVNHAVGPGWAKVGGRLPLRGRNLPSGSALMLGYFVRWGED